MTFLTLVTSDKLYKHKILLSLPKIYKSRTLFLNWIKEKKLFRKSIHHRISKNIFTVESFIFRDFTFGEKSVQFRTGTYRHYRYTYIYSAQLHLANINWLSSDARLSPLHRAYIHRNHSPSPPRLPGSSTRGFHFVMYLPETGKGKKTRH